MVKLSIKMMKMQGYITSKCMISVAVSIVLCIVCSSAFSAVPSEQLHKQLAAIHAKNQGEEDKIDREQLETQCLKLIEDCNSPSDTGKVYTTIALIYSEAGYFSPNDIRIPKAKKYAKKALEYPLDVISTCEMYGRWAGSLMVAYFWDKPEEVFVKMRQEAIVLCLKGLKIALDNGAPKTRKPPPTMSFYTFTGDRNSNYYEEIKKKQKQEFAARQKWEFEHKLYNQRRVLTQKCITLYTHKPYNLNELKTFAEENIKDYDEVIKELLNKVTSASNPIP